jgi:hypothetical protein
MRDPMPSVPSETSPGAQNMKTGPDALGTIEKLVRARKIRKRDPTPSVQSKSSQGAQNMKTETSALGTIES